MHNLILQHMSILNDLVIENDPVKKATSFFVFMGLTASQPSLGTRRQNFSLQSSE